MFPSSILAISLPLLAIPVVIVVGAIAAYFLTRGSSEKKRTASAWQAAADELGIGVRTDESKLGPTARGVVHEHQVAIAPDEKLKGMIFTQYGVAFAAPEAPNFRLTARSINTDLEIIDTGNPKFDAFVAVETDDASKLACFLTPPRRAAILRLLAFWPTAEVLNTEAYIREEGIEEDPDKLVDSICHLVAAAEAFDRPAVAAPGTSPCADEEAEGDLLIDTRLDEATVLSELFDSELDQEGMLAVFEDSFQGHEVSWSGEVMRIGSYDAHGRVQVVLLIGSADGQNPESGRVFATTAVPSDPYLAEGKVLTFEGKLVALDTEQRLFQLYAAPPSDDG